MEPLGVKHYTHAGFQVWYNDYTNDNLFKVCGNITQDPDCGNDGLNVSKMCPTKQAQCVNNTCPEVCKGFAPEGGPHCRNPLAPAKNFCNFEGNSTDNWGSEWNEVVKKATTRVLWEQTCVWGKPPLPIKTFQRPADKEAVQKVEEEANKQKNKDQDGGKSGHETPEETDTPAKASPGDQDHEGHPGEMTEAAESNQTCFQTDVTYNPLDMDGHYFTTESDAWNCQRRCAGIKGCKHFSFFRRDEDGDCHVTDSIKPQKDAKGFVSGPKTCEVDAKDSPYVEFLSSVTDDKGLPPAGFFVPGLSAAGVMAGYFAVLGLLALANVRRPDARTGLPPIEEDSVPMLTSSNRTMSVDGRFRPPSPAHDSDHDSEPSGV